MTGEQTGGPGQRGPRPPDAAAGAAAESRPASLAGRPGDAPLLEQSFDASSMYQLRAAVAAHAGPAGLSRARADDLVVAVHELAANIVRHGSGHGRLSVWRDTGELRCQITEEGGQRPAAGQRGGPGGGGGPGGELPWRIQPGHGLWLVRELADHAELRPGPDGVTTTITFRLHSGG